MLVGVNLCVLGDADHGKNFLEVGRESEEGHVFTRLAGLHQELNHERDAT
jgi:hypothetical protein